MIDALGRDDRPLHHVIDGEWQPDDRPSEMME
jgi:hypothetical protein